MIYVLTNTNASKVAQPFQYGGLDDLSRARDDVKKKPFGVPLVANIPASKSILRFLEVPKLWLIVFLITTPYKHLFYSLH